MRLASRLPRPAPAPVTEQRAGPGDAACDEGQFPIHFFAAWVTWIRAGGSRGCRQQPFPTGSTQLRRSWVTDLTPTVPRHPPSPPHGPEMPRTLFTNGEG